MKIRTLCNCCTTATGSETTAPRRGFLGALGVGLAAAAFPEVLLPGRAFAQSGLTTLPIAELIGSGAHNAGLVMAQAKGFVEAQGLRIDAKEYAAGAFVIQGMAAGDVVAGVCGINPTLLGRAQGLDIKILATANLEGSVLIVGPDVKSPKDLNGRKVGTPGIAAIQDTLMLLYEQKHNIKTEHVFVRVTDMPTLLRKGEIAGYIVWEATGSSGLAMSGGRVLATSRDIRVGHECCGLVASGKFLKNDPDSALRLVRAFAQGLRYAASNADELAQVVARHDGLEPELARKALANVRYKYPPVNDPADLAFVVQALMKADKIDRGQVPNVDRFIADAIDNRMIKSVTA